MENPCPDDSIWAGFLEQQLEPAQLAALHQHVRTCERCHATLAGLAAEDGVASLDTRPPLPDGALEPAAGETLGRYTLLKLVGHGAMGQVFAARDAELGRTVALKLLRSQGTELAERGHLRERLRREAQAMARLTHANVVAVHDVGTDRDRDFVAMEYVEGTTLRAWLAGRPRTPDEVLELFLRAGEGLAAAHAAGLVHRDFKPENVLVSSDGRPRVTDFGLASALGESQPVPTGASAASMPEGATLTATGALLGTPAYMAPEQLRGERVDARADQFAFCVSLYEALHGVRPFPSGTVHERHEAIQAARLAAPVAGRARSPEIDAVLERGLKFDPAQRFADMPALLAALRTARDRPRIRRARLTALAAGLVLALALGGGAVALQRLSPRWHPPATGRAKVALLGLSSDDPAPESSWRAAALSEMLSGDLNAGERMVVLGAPSMAREAKEHGLALGTEPTPQALQGLRAHLGTDIVLAGSVSSAGQPGQAKVTLRLRAWDAATGKHLADLEEHGDEQHLFALVREMGDALRGKLGIARPTEADLASLRTDFESSASGSRLYGEALARLRTGDSKGALGFLQQAAAAEPSSVRVQIALARTQLELGQAAAGQASAERAWKASATASRREQLEAEELYRENTRDYDRAVELLRSLWTFYPDSPEYLLRLAQLQIEHGQAKESLQVFDELHRLPPPVGTNPQIDTFEAHAANAVGDYARAVTSAQRGREHARALGLAQPAALAHYVEGAALFHLGRNREAAAALQAAVAELDAAGDHRNALNARRVLANLLIEQTDYVAAREQAEKVLADAREAKDEATEATALSSLGMIADDLGEITQARQVYEAALKIQIEQGDVNRQGALFHNLAANALNAGDLTRAHELAEKAFVIKRDAGDLLAAASAKLLVARVALEQADAAATDRELHEAIALRAAKPAPYLQEQESFLRSELAQLRGDLKASEALLRAGLGEVKNPASEEAASRRCGLARLLARTGRTEEARALVQAAQTQLAHTQDPGYVLGLALARADVSPCSEAGSIRAQLQGLIDGERKGERYVSTRARLGAGKLERRCGNAAEAKKALAQVQANAQQLGLLRIAREAAEAQRGR